MCVCVWGGDRGPGSRGPSGLAPPQGRLLGFPHPQGEPGSLCGLRLFAPDPDLAMRLIWFLNSGLAAAGRAGGLLAVLKPADWIAFRPL